MKVTWVYAGQEPMTIKEFLKQKHISRGAIAQAKQVGQILINDQPKYVNALLHAGDVLTFALPPEGETLTTGISDEPIEILYEDDWFLVVNKPANIASIPSSIHLTHTMTNRVKGYFLRQGYEDCIPHVVTRLDRDTTGVMLFAKNRVAHAWMAVQLNTKELKKVYRAIVHSQKDDPLPLHHVIEAPIGRKDGSAIERIVRLDGKPSTTEYWVEKQYDDGALVRIQLHTGRTHQIRVHFNHLNHSLWGDDLYGGVQTSELPRQALHCAMLQFKHPLSEEILTVEAELPDDMRQWIARKEASVQNQVNECLKQTNDVQRIM